MEVSAKELRRKTRLLLDTVERGQAVTITYRGRARARVVPMKKGPERAESVKQDELFGLWADRDDLVDPQAWVRTLRQSRYP
ncbi:type II toxin-antitoxin system Phd/YefM family antitoxin [Candidatus Thiosymbion oneisti]|uniref:type II toxin-antitoxin system Phd/YefM family antitoxin n=1 Tax=Candidatus Thiosymbion oneisti TaxID=589554 RepID=UPI0010610571|nr:type II toxin-antitoxin system prevent-host-death family antitoxin [Candidatus Thiosymbion oneisti]